MGIGRKAAVWSVIGAAAFILALFAMPSYRQGEDSIAGRKAQDFSLQLDGKSQRLSDLKGKVVVLNFWASWCPPCLEETPALNKLQKYIESRNALILGASVDEDNNAYEKFLVEQKVVFPTFRDPQNVKLSHDYGTSIYPETYIIDRHGKIARKIIGFQQWDSPEMLAYFDAVLKQN